MTHREFIAAVTAVIGQEPQPDKALPKWSLKTGYKTLFVDVRDDPPRIFLRFTDDGQLIFPDGVNPHTGIWDICPKVGFDESLRGQCVRELARRLAIAGYVPPEAVQPRELRNAVVKRIDAYCREWEKDISDQMRDGEFIRLVEWPEGWTPPQPPVADANNELLSQFAELCDLITGQENSFASFRNVKERVRDLLMAEKQPKPAAEGARERDVRADDNGRLPDWCKTGAGEKPTTHYRYFINTQGPAIYVWRLDPASGRMDSRRMNCLEPWETSISSRAHHWIKEDGTPCPYTAETDEFGSPLAQTKNTNE